MYPRKMIGIGVIFGVLYLLFEGGGALILTKLLVQSATRTEAGVFTLITYTLALSNLLITSLGPAITRSISQAIGSAECSDEQVRASRATVFLSLILMSAIFIGIVSFHRYILKDDLATIQIWGIFLTGHLLRLYGFSQCYILLGYGKIGADRFYQCLFSLCYLLLACLLFHTYKTLNSISTAYLLVGLFCASTSWIVTRLFHKKISLKIKPKKRAFSDNAMISNIRQLVFEGGALILNNAIGFVLVNGDVFIVQYLFGKEILAEYALYSRLCALIIATAGLIPQMYFPLVSKSWAQNDLLACLRYRKDGLLYSLGFAFIGSTLSILIYGWVIKWVFAMTTQISSNILYLVSIYALLLVHTAANGLPVIATGKTAFIKLSLYNACLCLLLGWGGGMLFGVLGVLGGFIVGSLLPNWIYRRTVLKLFTAPQDNRIAYN
jgi:O-antigen/teichoic acid export membrane protein